MCFRHHSVLLSLSIYLSFFPITAYLWVFSSLLNTQLHIYYIKDSNPKHFSPAVTDLMDTDKLYNVIISKISSLELINNASDNRIPKLGRNNVTFFNITRIFLYNLMDPNTWIISFIHMLY